MVPTNPYCKEFTFPVEKWSQRKRVPRIWRSNMDLRSYMDHAADELILALDAHIAIEHLGVIRYPADWWQAVKARFFPQWLLHWWPVAYTVNDVRLLYPEIDTRAAQGFKTIVQVHTATMGRSTPIRSKMREMDRYSSHAAQGPCCGPHPAGTR